jgi:exosortase
MQLLASKAAAFLLDAIGVPIARSGNILILPDYQLEVAEACSGLRSLVSLLALGALYGYLRMPGKVLPVILFLATPFIAIGTNVFRVFATAVGAWAISKQMAEDFLHEISGLVVFVVALILMVILGAILQWIRNRLRSS